MATNDSHQPIAAIQTHFGARADRKFHFSTLNIKCVGIKLAKVKWYFREGKRQPDNHEGIKAGKLRKVSDPVGLTIEGLQEWHDEACLAVLNNKYQDGISWHDVACHFRSKIVCEDSEALLARVIRENPGATIAEPVPQKNWEDGFSFRLFNGYLTYVITFRVYIPV